MEKYHKIQTVWERDHNNNYKTLIAGAWATPAFEYLAQNHWVYTEKVDGTNIRIIWDGERIEFRGRTDRAQIPPFLLDALRENTDPVDFANVFDAPVCLYGEGYGPKIQRGGKYRADASFVLFDVKIGRYWLHRIDVETIAAALGLGVVPIIGDGTLLEMIATVRSGLRSQWGGFEAEGIVARPAVPMFDRRGKRIITKIKGRDFPQRTKLQT